MGTGCCLSIDQSPGKPKETASTKPSFLYLCPPYMLFCLSQVGNLLPPEMQVLSSNSTDNSESKASLSTARFSGSLL